MSHGRSPSRGPGLRQRLAMSIAMAFAAKLSPAHAELCARAIPQAQLHRLPGRDHQLNNALSEVAEVIKRLGPGGGDGDVVAAPSAPLSRVIPDKPADRSSRAPQRF